MFIVEAMDHKHWLWIIPERVNSLWTSDTIRWHWSGSISAQIMACCLTTPSHYLNADFPLVRSCSIHLKAIQQEICQIYIIDTTWWRHQMETFSALLAICAGNPPVPGEFPAQRLVTRSFDVFFDLRLNKRLSKQSWGWWFATPPCPLWRHSNECENYQFDNTATHSKSQWLKVPT